MVVIMKKLFFILAIIMLAGCGPTTDLSTRAQQAQWEAERLQKEAEMYNAAMTATANAPIAQVTAGAAVLELERQRSMATATAVQATIQAAWSPTPNATSTMVMAVLEGQQTAIAAESARNILELDRQRSSNQFKAMMPGLTFAFLAIVAVWEVMAITRRERVRAIPRDARGDAPLLLDVLDGVVSDPDANPNYASGTRRLKAPEDDPLPQLPAITAERQDKVKQNDQLLDLATRGLPVQGNGSTQEERRRLAAEEAMRGLPSGTERFSVLGPGEKPPESVVDDVTIEILDAQWKEVKDE